MPVPAADDHREEARQAARHVAARLLGGEPKCIEQQTGGLNNFVFNVQHRSGDFIVRLGHDHRKLTAFRKEEWAMSRAREAGIPVAHVLEIGGDPMPYMVMHKTPGHPATVHPHQTRIIRSLGRCAAVINSIATEGFGGKFNTDMQRLSDYSTWHEFLRDELKLEERIRTLESAGLIEVRRLQRIRALLECAADGNSRTVLNHGDLRLKNLIVDDDGRIRAILDWENCSSSLAPQWEMSLALHDLSIDTKQEFIRGYGLSPRTVLEIAPVMQALNVINYAPHVRHAIERNDAGRLEWYRLRFSGALDLYSV